MHIGDIGFNRSSHSLPRSIGQMRGALAFLTDRFAGELGLPTPAGSDLGPPAGRRSRAGCLERASS
eukprot:2939239-Pyramimonas_sp.AAC.1